MGEGGKARSAAKVGDAGVIAMRGAGYYSANTVGAKAVIDAAGDLVMECLETMPVAEPGFPLAFADYGAADGGTSADMWRRVAARLRKRAPKRQMSLVYTDLPHNDFSVLFQMIHGLLPGPETPPLGAEPNLFTFASGASFYRQILPDASLGLGFSATAMHWLSRLPGPIAEHTHAVGASPAEKAVFRQAALDDWETILLARARELAPGGRLVLVNFCEDEHGRYLGNTGGVSMHDRFAAHWRALWRAGAITEEEFRRAAFPQYYKTREEFTAPLEDPSSPVRHAGLRLETAFTRVTGCPYAAAFRREGDAAAFAKAYIPTLRSWTQSTFLGALDGTRPAAERMAILDRFYGAYEAEVAADPQGHAMDYVHCFMVVSKGV